MCKILGKPKKNAHLKLRPMTHFGQSGVKLSALLIALLFALTLFMSCSDGGSSGSSESSESSTSSAAADLSSFTMPTEISAVPVDTDAADASAAFNRSFSSNLRALARAATDAGTDYSEAETRKYVEEHALEQFAILESVLNALSQTNYTDEIGNGPYKAMVAFQDDEEGTNKKSLEAWVCQSDEMVDADGNSYLRARAWIEEQDDDGEDELIKAEFRIYAPPTKNTDGSYADYGEWDLNVKFGDDGTEDFFAASCEVNADGISVLKVHELFLESGPGETEFEMEMMGILYRSGTDGYGKVQYPDWEELWGPDADPNLTELTPIVAAYAYNEAYLAVKDGDNDPVYKDRTDIVEMTHRYGVYHADTGEDVLKSKSFGFPIYWTTDGGSTKRAYYGAWQGRHQLWTQDGETVAEGTTVTREDFDPSTTPQTYTVGETFDGVLSRRTYVDASLDDIKGIAVELWIDNQYNLTYNAGNQTWYHCSQMDWAANPPSCLATPLDFDAEIGFASLVVGADDTKKNVNIGGWDQTADPGQENKTYVYELASADNGSQAGFYEATESQGEYGPVITVNDPRQLIDTTKVTQLWIWVGGSIYVEYTGAGNTGWVEKELINFDQRTWTPEFGPNDKDFILPENKELYINMQGSNFVVRKETGQDPTCQLELQTAVNPNNATEIVPVGTVFSDPWNAANSTYELITDSADADYLMLVYLTIGDNDRDQDGDPNEGLAVGDVAGNIWGIEADIDGATVAFNWEYSAGGGWGSVSYLKNLNGSYKLLDDPIRFDSITAQNGAGDTKTIALQYDGWMMGLPEMYQELEKSDWTMNDEIAGKILNLPAGTQVTDAATGIDYLLKPLEISQFLSVTADTTGLPDVSAGQDVDLSTVPDFVEHGMGDIPADVELLYSEGNPIE